MTPPRMNPDVKDSLLLLRSALREQRIVMLTQVLREMFGISYRHLAITVSWRDRDAAAPLAGHLRIYTAGAIRATAWRCVETPAKNRQAIDTNDVRNMTT